MGERFIAADTIVMPGRPVRVRIEGFPPAIDVTLMIGSMYEAAAGEPIGATTTDAEGRAVVSGVIPSDAAYGDTTLSVMASAGCGAETYVSIVGSPEAIAIDDDTVVPGQQVTIMASGFQPGEAVSVMLDGDAFDLLSEGRRLGEAPSNDAGFVRITVRIPPDTSPGRHFLTANGYSFNGENDLFLSVNVVVEA